MALQHGLSEGTQLRYLFARGRRPDHTLVFIARILKTAAAARRFLNAFHYAYYATCTASTGRPSEV